MGYVDFPLGQNGGSGAECAKRKQEIEHSDDGVFGCFGQLFVGNIANVGEGHDGAHHAQVEHGAIHQFVSVLQ